MKSIQLAFKKAAIALALVFFVVSCTKKEGTYTSAIPADAEMVVSVNIKQLFDKGGLNDADKEKLSGMLSGGMSAESTDKIGKILKDPTVSGVSLKDPVYLFSSESLNEPVLALKVSDLGKLKQTIAMLELEGVIDDEHNNTDENYFMLYDGTQCLYNDHTLLMSKNDKNTLTSLLKQTTEKSIASKESFKQMLDKTGDLKFYVKMSAIPDIKKYISMFAASMPGIDLDKVFYVGGVSFENGKIASNVVVTSDDKATTEMFKQQMQMQGNIKHSFTTYYPASLLAFGAVNMKGDAIKSYMDEHGELFRDFPKEGIEIIKQVVEQIKGDVTFGLTDIGMASGDMIVYAEVDAKAIQALIDKYAAGNGITIIDDHTYKMRAMHGLDLIFGCKDNYFFAATSEAAYKGIGIQKEPSVKNAAYASNMNGMCQYFVIDVANILKNPMVQMAAAFGGQEAAAYMDMASTVAFVELMSETDGQTKFNISFVDQKTNALKQIFDKVKEYAGI